MPGRKRQLVSYPMPLKDAVRESCAVTCSLLGNTSFSFECCTVCVTAALKDKGNEAYTREDYETAVKCYSDGLNELRDMQPLYTNRAQVNIFSLCCYK